MAEMCTPHGLPFETVSLVMQFSEKLTLSACTLASHAMREIARPWLFRTITLKDNNSQTINYDVLRQLDEAPQLKGYVQEVVHFKRVFCSALSAIPNRHLANELMVRYFYCAIEKFGFACRGHLLGPAELLDLIRTMPNLTHLDIFYDNYLMDLMDDEIKNTNSSSRHLKELVVRHQGLSCPAHFDQLFVWIKALIPGISSPIKSLHVIAIDSRLCATALFLLQILGSPLFNALDTLRMPEVVLQKEDLWSVLQLRHIKELELYLGDTECIVNPFNFQHDSCIEKLDLASLAPNLSVLRWTTELNQRTTMAKMKNLVEALGHNERTVRGPLRKSLKPEWKVPIPTSPPPIGFADAGTGHVECDGM
ncbi:hypothetical protein FIBSPDRAFT_926223 [Athelia psychrophila]|uniref:F-box domain-containing protein n=1 Tax=Athelia psychrophila TaxID=1759441 RepID=A0A166TM12_9AGAM|nr:hypothetical protein FIBSPDRAFT_926223 [Fibularhizoctonia sp. CBS 109695]